MTRLRALGVLFSLWTLMLLAACASQDASPVVVSPPPRATPATSTPALRASIDELALVPGGAPGDWWAVGLVGNPLNQPVSLSPVQVRLADEAGVVLAEGEAQLAIDRLMPGEQSPFALAFSGVLEASTAQAEAPAQPAETFRRARVVLRDLRTWPEIPGGWVVIGSLVNRSSAPAAVDGAAVLTRQPSGLATGVTQASGLCSYLLPGESCPFTARFPAGLEPLDLTGFVDAAETARLATPSLSFPDEVRLLADVRGDPLVVGSLRNEADDPLWVAIQVMLRRGAETVTAGWVMPPVPVLPGETRAFALADFPAWGPLSAEAEWEIEDLEVELAIDPRRTISAPEERTSLEAEVAQFEQVSDRLFLRGSLRNGWTSEVARPSALATVRRTDGRLVTAGWVTLAGPLAPEEAGDFLLVLPLPPRADVAMSEFDLIGSGVIP